MKVKHLTQGALFCALYVALCHLQNLLLPGSTSALIQVRAAEALCILAFFTPAAIGGLTLGCFLYNLTFAGALPLDIVIGTLATLFSLICMYFFRRITVKKVPLLGLFMPIFFNGLLVGAELTYYFGGGLPFNIFCVAAGEAIAVLVLGTGLYFSLKPHAAKLT